MTTLFIILGLSLFTLLVSRRREWGIYLILLLLPAYQIRFRVADIPLTFLEAMILILAVIVIVTEVFSARGGSAFGGRLPEADKSANYSGDLPPSLKLRRTRKVSVTNILILLFLLAATISIFVSPLPIKAAGIWKAYFVEPVIFYFLVKRIINTKEKLGKVVTSLTWLVLALSMFGLYQFLTLANLPFSWWAVEVAGRRITSLLNHPNALALLLGPLLALLIFLPKKSKLHWAGIVLGSMALYLSFSRAAWLALIATILIFKLVVAPFMGPDPEGVHLGGPYGAGKSGNYKKAASIVFIIILAILIIPFSRQKLLELTSQSDPSRQNRIVLWSAASDMLKKSPILGVGLMGFREHYQNYPLGPDRVVQNYPHNFFLNFWLETSLLGLISIIGLLILFYHQRPPLPVAAAMTMILLHGLVDVPYFKNDLSVLFWLVYGLGLITTRRSGSSPELSVVTSGRPEISA